MKSIKALCILFLLIINADLAVSQYVSIPDPAFINWLSSNGYSSCISGNQLDTTCSSLVNATFINCSNASISDLSGIEYFDNLDQLECSYNNLTSLPALPSTLTKLFCGNNQITSLPALPSQMVWLYCLHNSIDSLPALPSTLKVLECSFNDLSSIPVLPSGLGSLTCSFNLISSLPLLTDSITHLSCSYNQLTALPALPQQLQKLYCAYNNLTSLPSLPPDVDEINCKNNQIAVLPTLPPKLYTFTCSYNQLTSIPPVSDSLKTFICNNNLLTTIPQLINTNLTHIDCSFNQVTTLPDLPSSVKSILCFDNNLTSLGLLPDSLTIFRIYNNPSLVCFLRLPDYIGDFDFTSTGITCFPNLFSYSTVQPTSALPLCNPFSPSGCPYYWNITGNIYNDSISDCIYSSGEKSLANIKVNLYEDTILVSQTFTLPDGMYGFAADTGTYTISIDLPGAVVNSCIVQHSAQVTPSAFYHDSLDFGLVCGSNYDLGISSIIRRGGLFRPGSIAYIGVNAGEIANQYSLHCAAGISGSVKIIISGPASYLSPMPGALTPVVSGDTLIYSIPDFGAVSMRDDFRFSVLIDTMASVFQQVCIESFVNPLMDADSSNNHYKHCFNIVNSYDPNNKEISSLYTFDLDTLPHYLTYTINFQNTGTAPAINIMIKDTIDSNLELSSLTVTDYSVAPLTYIQNNVINFRFNNINLPDSTTDEPNSHGFVQYKILLKGSRPLGTYVHNVAHIYFDFNSPVITNDAVHLITLSPEVSQTDQPSSILIYPNPVTGNGTIYFRSEGNTVISPGILTDNTGREIMKFCLTNNSVSEVHLNNLQDGIYFIYIPVVNGLKKGCIIVKSDD